jgi:hypothetical protein
VFSENNKQTKAYFGLGQHFVQLNLQFKKKNHTTFLKNVLVSNITIWKAISSSATIDVSIITKLHSHRWKHHNLVPWDKHCAGQGMKWAALELQGHSPSSIHQHIKPEHIK